MANQENRKEILDKIYILRQDLAPQQRPNILELPPRPRGWHNAQQHIMNPILGQALWADNRALEQRQRHAREMEEQLQRRNLISLAIVLMGTYLIQDRIDELEEHIQGPFIGFIIAIIGWLLYPILN